MEYLATLNKFSSLKYRQLIIIVGVSVVVSSIASLAFFGNDYTTSRKNISGDLLDMARLIETDIITSGVLNNRQGIQRALSVSRADKAVLQVSLYDLNEKQMAVFRGDMNVSFEPESFSRLGVSLNADTATILHPVKLDDELQGWLYIVYDSSVLGPQSDKYAGILFVIMVFGLAIGWLMSSILHKFIIEPIVELASLVEKISDTKNYSQRMHAERDDEIGVLINGFNNMLATIQDRELELKRNSERLESIVELRTKQLHHRANYDALTRLPNRYLLMEKLHQAIESCRRNDRNMALLLIDLDRFKIINDSLGHHVGDELLQIIARKLSEIGRIDDCVGRLGGDEFVILLGNISAPEDAEVVARKVIKELSLPLSVQQHRLHVSASIGISVFPRDAEDAATLLKRADIGMYSSKAYGKGAYRFYDSSLDNTDERLILESKLRHAIENDELYLVYQPQVCLQSNLIVGVEALLRWDNPEHGEIDPRIFVPMAEEIGFINQLSAWVVENVCRQYETWSKQGLPPFKIAVNVSASDLLRPKFLSFINENLNKYQMDPGFLEIEITENVFLEKTDQIINVLQELKTIGVTIAIDDFGTGYSSLSYLQNFPIDVLKLDGSFVKNIHNSEKSRGIVSSAISLAHGLGLKIVAECVDMRDQLDFLVAENCDIIQGYHFSEPVVGDALAMFFNAQKSSLIRAC